MKNSKIVIQKRHNHILELLKQNRTMDVTVLAERLGVTGATIRRDLKKLEQEGTIVRSFGKVSFVGKINVEEIEPTNIEDEKKNGATCHRTICGGNGGERRCTVLEQQRNRLSRCGVSGRQKRYGFDK